jgi:hypothetical protein
MRSSRWEVPPENLRVHFDLQNVLFETTGTQGVIIPRQNLKYLMLYEDVVEAVASGRFHIYAVSNMDEVLEILMGRPAGERQPDGRYPVDSVNAAVLKRLYEMNDRLPALETARKSHQTMRSPRKQLP